MSDSLWPHGLYSPWNLPGHWSGWPFLSPGDLLKPGIEPRSPSSESKDRTFCISDRFFTSEPPGKPKNTEVGSLSLLQWIFLTQELNQGLLHCRRFFTNWTTREALKRLWLIKENQIIQVKKFISFLVWENKKNLDSLKSSFSYASQVSGSSILCFSHSEFTYHREWLQSDSC